jgi:hypothetical protein
VRNYILNEVREIEKRERAPEKGALKNMRTG